MVISLIAGSRPSASVERRSQLESRNPVVCVSVPGDDKAVHCSGGFVVIALTGPASESGILGTDALHYRPFKY